jgi:hypothetical protein
MKKKLRSLSLFFFCCAATLVQAGDGCRLWFRYNQPGDSNLLAGYTPQIRNITVDKKSATQAAAYDELNRVLPSLPDAKIANAAVQEHGIEQVL